MADRLSAFIDVEFDQMKKDLAELVSIPSVLDPATACNGSPFGRNAAEALDKVLRLASSMGFRTRNYDGYAGEVTLGSGSHMVGILGHIDVVAAGDGWNTPPFEMTVENGCMYGRGTSDDKGPLVSSLYAMKYIDQKGLLPEGSSVRLIIGADEEEELRCIEYYLAHADRLPDVSFVPDGYFPLVNCEKGLIDFDLNYASKPDANAEAFLEDLYGGTGRNMVPGKASCKIRLSEAAVNSNRAGEMIDALKGFKGISVSGPDSEGCITLGSEGISTHAMSPEKGRNAISHLLHALYGSGIRFDHRDFIDSYEHAIGLDIHAERLGCNWADEESGELTFNVGIIEQNSDGFVLRANTRWPVSYSYEDIAKHLVAGLESFGFKYSELLYMPSLNISRDSELITKLMEAYTEITDDTENDAFSIGGATYARSIPNAVSFGPLFPYETELAHEANECLSEDSFRKMTMIYIRALEKLV